MDSLARSAVEPWYPQCRQHIKISAVVTLNHRVGVSRAYAPKKKSCFPETWDKVKFAFPKILGYTYDWYQNKWACFQVQNYFSLYTNTSLVFSCLLILHDLCFLKVLDVNIEFYWKRREREQRRGRDSRRNGGKREEGRREGDGPRSQMPG